MKRTRYQIRAELLAEAEVVVDELLDWHENNQALTLIQVEEVILKLRKRLGQRMAEEILQRIGQTAISDSSIWRLVQRCGEGFRAVEEAERVVANALPRGREIPHREAKSVGRLGVGMDGTIIYPGRRMEGTESGECI